MQASFNDCYLCGSNSSIVLTSVFLSKLVNKKLLFDNLLFICVMRVRQDLISVTGI
jgi:hypothetical protein